MTRLLLDWLLPTQRLVAFLEAAVAYERAQREQEVARWQALAEQARAREEVAVARLVALKVGVDLQRPAPTADQLEALVETAQRELAQQEEWVQAGQVA